jgi:hypothetical protein
MKLKDFDELVRRDFDNAAVTNAIRQVFKERDELLKVVIGLDEISDELARRCSYEDQDFIDWLDRILVLKSQALKEINP